MVSKEHMELKVGDLFVFKPYDNVGYLLKIEEDKDRYWISWSTQKYYSYSKFTLINWITKSESFEYHPIKEID